MEYKPAAKDTAKFVLHFETSFVNVPIGTLIANPSTPQVAGERMLHKTVHMSSKLPSDLYGTGTPNLHISAHFIILTAYIAFHTT